MAFWMTHLRVAEAVLPYLPAVSLEHYYVGTLGPDCGRTEANPDGSPLYLPGRITSHWIVKDEELGRTSIGFEEFFAACFPLADTAENRAFYWGYYIHLITDAMWGEQVMRPRKKSLAEPTPENVKAIKDDIYRADLRFLQGHPDYPPLAAVEAVTRFPNVYLDYYNDTDLENQMHEAPAQLRRDAVGEVPESLWLADEELDEFVMFATAKCIQQIKKHLAAE